jgi:hypothetical protein
MPISTAPAPASSGLRLKAASIHFGASLGIALLASLLVFLIWFPPPFSALAGGSSLFLILVGVDVVMGPALTLVVASPSKPKRELARDMVVIIALQAAAFGYGVYTMALARPALLVFEVDRLRVLSANDFDDSALALAPAGLRRLSWTGPKKIAVIKPSDPTELLQSLSEGLAGVPLAARPKYWRTYESQATALWQRAKPAAALAARYPQLQPKLAEWRSSEGLPIEALRFLPVQARQGVAVALFVEKDARILGFLPVDGDF